MMWTSTFIIRACFLAALAPGLIGCGPKNLKSSDGRFQITVPVAWKTKEPKLKGSVISASNQAGTVVVMVSADLAAAIPERNIDEFLEGNRTGLIADGETRDVTAIGTVQINGRAARQYEITRLRYSIRCLMTAVDATEYFVMVAACSDLPVYDEQKGTLQQITDSFRTLH